MNNIPLSAASQPIDWTLFRQRILESNRVLITSHIRPDGDCLGSEIAMSRALQHLGKEVLVVNVHPTPPNLQFLDPDHHIRCLKTLSEQEKNWIETVDLFLVVDTSSWAQLNEMGPLLQKTSARKMVLDHHAIGNDLGAEMFVDSHAEACGILCYEAIKVLEIPLTPNIAEPLFTAIATDTGWFRFASTQSRTFQAAATLIDAGVRPDHIYRELYEQESLARTHLMGRVLSRVESYEKGAVFMSWITLEDFDDLGALASDSEDIVNKMLEIAGSKVALILVELRTGGFKTSFRSRCEVDCSQLAARFGGGGHKRAAGALLQCSLEDAKQQVLSATMEAYTVNG